MVTMYKNFFQPTIKLVEKIRVGGKIHRKYDEPRTPFQRVMESGQIFEAAGKRLLGQVRIAERGGPAQTH
jgi:hypothetical protein